MEKIEIVYKEIEYIVEGDFDAGEPEKRTLSDGSPGYEGSAPSFWITKVVLADDGTDVTEHLNTKDFAEIQEIVLREFED